LNTSMVAIGITPGGKSMRATRNHPRDVQLVGTCRGVRVTRCWIPIKSGAVSASGPNAQSTPPLAFRPWCIELTAGLPRAGGRWLCPAERSRCHRQGAQNGARIIISRAGFHLGRLLWWHGAFDAHCVGMLHTAIMDLRAPRLTATKSRLITSRSPESRGHALLDQGRAHHDQISAGRDGDVNAPDHFRDIHLDADNPRVRRATQEDGGGVVLRPSSDEKARLNVNAPTGDSPNSTDLPLILHAAILACAANRGSIPWSANADSYASRCSRPIIRETVVSTGAIIDVRASLGPAVRRTPAKRVLPRRGHDEKTLLGADNLRRMPDGGWASTLTV